MRLNLLWASMAAVCAMGLVAAEPSKADGYYAYKKYKPAYYPAPRRQAVVTRYFATDPYAYSYEPRGYYPYYDSGYWRVYCGGKLNCVPVAYQPPYWKAWGYPKPWHNRAFHRVYHGRIYPWHW